MVTNKAEVMTLLVNAGCRIDVHSKPGVYPVGLMRDRIHRLQNQSRISKDDLHRETVMVRLGLNIPYSISSISIQKLFFNFGIGNKTKIGTNQLSDRKSTRLNSSHPSRSRMPSSA